jgi:outer membrane translocation and assembly module TamA
VKNTAKHYITSDHGIDSSLFGKNEFVGVEAAYHFRKVNDEIFPTAGFDFTLAGEYVRNMQQWDRAYKNAVSSLAIYIPLGRAFSIATRAGGAALLGDADFYDFNTLDGYVNLRGYERERFSGKSVFYNNNEIRCVTNTRNYLFNGKIGLLAFCDQGRAWQPLERSDKWHTGYGGGLILIPFGTAPLTATYCTSVEGNFIQLKAGMFF